MADAFLLPSGLFKGTEKRLIETGPNQRAWLTEQQILEKIQRRERFMDVTDYQEELDVDVYDASEPELKVPGAPAHQDFVKPLFANISEEGVNAFLRKFTAFHTRYYRSETGSESSRFLLAELQAIVDANQHPGREVSVTPFKHSWNQPSIILRIAAAAARQGQTVDGPQKPIVPAKTETVIVGSHQDSVNGWNPFFGRSPGADDNGSGTVTAREAARILLQSDFVPKYPVEFHFYAAEEGGLLGSQAVSAAYKQQGRKAVMMQMDMSGYIGATGGERREVIGVGTDFVNDELSMFLRKLIEEYNQVKWVETKCGYGCSDHGAFYLHSCFSGCPRGLIIWDCLEASWFKLGYRTAFPFEAPFEQHNPNIHTSDDTIQHLSMKVELGNM